MKYIWEEKDIEVGLFVIRNTVSPGLPDKSYAKTVVFKLGFAYTGEKHARHWTKTRVLTDGLTTILYKSDEIGRVAELLTAGNYRPLKKSELITLIESTDQGFYAG